MQAMRGERSTVSILDRIAMLVDLERAGLETEAVQAFLLGTRVEPTSLGPYLHFDRTHYMRNLIYRTDGFELLAICWEIGQAAPIHDHEDQRCWARVEQGTLRFTNFRLLADDLLRLEQVGPAVPGEVGHLDALAGIHSVANHPSVGQRAVSLAPVFAAIPRVHGSQRVLAINSPSTGAVAMMAESGGPSGCCAPA